MGLFPAPPIFLLMKKPFFARHALLVLIVVFFFVPFAMRGSRYAVQRMKNDVKDWLPADFPETAELDWFRERFMGEQFILISWEGCRGTKDDRRFIDFVDSLFPSLPPSVLPAATVIRPETFIDPNTELYARSLVPVSAAQDESFIGNRLSLWTPEDVQLDWGGRREKWIRSGRNEWVYITPKGELFQWKGNRSWPAQLWRTIVRSVTGDRTVHGEFIASLGPIDGPWYYEDPQRLNARLFKSITTGPSVLSQLTGGKLNISREEAHERLRGILFGPDDKQTCIVVTLTAAAKRDPRAVVGRGMLGKPRGTLLDLAEAAGIQVPRPPPAMPGFLAKLFDSEQPVSDDPMLRLGGPTVDNAAIDEEGQITLARLLGLSLAVGLGLSWLCFRSLNITIMVFLVGGISAVASVGIVYWTGSQLDAVLMSMPSLVYVLGISGAVHVVNYYRESVAERGIQSAPDNAVKLGLWPCTMAAFTTSLGLVSLASSNIIPIQKFGLYSAIGVSATLILLFTYLPAALEIWPPRGYLSRSTSDDTHPPASPVERFLDRFWQVVGRNVIRHYRFVILASMLALVVGVYGLSRIKTSVQLLKLFDDEAKIIEDYEWMEANLGKLVPMELVIRVHPDLFDPSALDANLADAVNNPELLKKETQFNPLGMDFLERMEIAQNVALEIDHVFGEAGQGQLSRPMLASTFARAAPKGLWSAHTRKPVVRELEENRQAFVDADFLRDDPQDQHELWRISLRLAALDDIDFGLFVQQVKRVVEPIMLAYEYRDNIVSRLKTRDSAPVPRIFFVGYEPEETSGETPGRDAAKIDQTRIFVSHVLRLLRTENILPEENWNIKSQEQIEAVRPTDTIIVLKNVPEVSMAALDATRALRFDARSHEFNPRHDTTALQRGQRVSVVYTGLVPIVYKAQRTLLSSLIKSTALAFVMIAVVMIALLRSPSAGLISMFPNVFPVVIIFGIMGLLKTPVDIGSMMTASVAMGVAVDDTIHFLSWFRKALDGGHTRQESILIAYRRVATAMTQTTAIGGIGLSIFAFSTFTPTQMFGTLMLALLAAALLGDLFFLPALLASSLGRVFDHPRVETHALDDSRPTVPHIHGALVKDQRSPASDVHPLPPGMRHDQSH